MAAARAYVHALVRRQNDLLEKLAREHRGSRSVQALRERVLRGKQRYTLLYASPQVPSRLDRLGLGALIGLLLGASLLSLSVAAVRLTSPASVNPVTSAPVRLIGLLIGGEAAVIVVARWTTDPWVMYAVAAGLVLAAAVNLAYAGTRTSRLLILATIILVPLRGALLSLANVAGVPHSFFLVNAIAPVAVFCLALMNLRRLAPRLRAANPFQWALIGILLASALDLASQKSSIRLVAVGFVQYLTYPALAYFAWEVRKPLDHRRLALVLTSMASVVALSVFAEAAHLVRFTEAAAPIVPFLDRPRWGGATGSYLHASIFLGTSVPIVVGLVLGTTRLRLKLVLSACLLAILGALFLTNTRGGVAISVVGLLMLLFFLHLKHRVRLIAAAAAVLGIALALAVVGAGPTQIAPRLRTTFDLTNDPANVSRVATMKRAVRQFERAPLPQQLFGQGLGTTGNARKLVSLPGSSTENYFLKLLLEVGAVGLLVVGGFILWGVGLLVVVARRANRDAGLQGACVAGVALAAYGLAYPVLEPQVTAMTWWLLLAAGAAAYAEQAAQGRANVAFAEDRPPAANLRRSAAGASSDEAANVAAAAAMQRQR